MNFQLDYTAYDFASLEAQLISLMDQIGGWKDRSQSSNGAVIVDLVAGIGNMVMYSIERHREESYLATARLRSSIVELVKLLGYRVHRGISARGVLTVTIPQAIAYDIYIPAGTQFKSAGDYIYSAIQDYYIMAGTTSVDVTIIQGEINTVESVSAGGLTQTIQLVDTTVEDTYLDVYVNGVLWTKVDTLLFSEGLDLVYTESVNPDNTVTIYFGDNQNGKAPNINELIQITYIKTDGLAGNVYTAGQIDELVSKIYDLNGGEITNAVITNSLPILGGSDVESVEHIKYYAPKRFAAAQRCVTKEDFNVLVSDFPGVSDAKVWGEFENSAVPDIASFNTVYICCLLSGWSFPDQTFKDALGAYLANYSLLTVKYDFINPEIIDVVIRLSITCKQNSNLDSVRAGVSGKIGALFIPGETVTLGSVVNQSSVTNAIQSVSDVMFYTVSQQIQSTFTYNGGTSRWEVTLPLLNIKPGSVEIVYNHEVIAVDNSFNNIYNVTGGSFVVVGAIDYDTTGDCYITISGLSSGSNVYIRYKQIGDDITPGDKQICRLYQLTFDKVSHV